MELQKRLGQHRAGVCWKQQLHKKVVGPLVQLSVKD